MTIKINSARYAKGRMVAVPHSDGSGFKNKTHRVIERFGGRWVHRDEGYQLSARQTSRLTRACRFLKIDIACSRCSDPATFAVETRFGPEQVCGPCRAALVTDKQIEVGAA